MSGNPEFVIASPRCLAFAKQNGGGVAISINRKLVLSLSKGALPAVSTVEPSKESKGRNLLKFGRGGSAHQFPDFLIICFPAPLIP